MSDLFKDNNPELEQSIAADTTKDESAPNASADEDSTVFSTPAEHKDKSKATGGKKRLVSIIAACLAVAILVGGTLAVIKLIPEMTDDETPNTVFEDIVVVDADSSTFTGVTIKNKNGDFKFTTQQVTTTDEDGETKTTSYWTVDDVDYSKLSSSSLESIITSSASLIATREVSKTVSECGFDEPIVKVTVESSSNDPYTFVVGNESPDGLGYYLMLEGRDTIYVTPQSEFSAFEFTLLDITDTTAIPATTFTVDTSENKVSDGTYAYFDSLVLSGKLYPEPLTITNNPEETEAAQLTPYLVTTPMSRYANTESLVSPINLFSTQTSVDGNYALDITDETLKIFGLDNPDVEITMTISGESRTFKISKVDETYCAVVYDGAKMIRKVQNSSFDFLSLETEDFYYKSLFMYSITELSSLTLEEGEEDIKFDISRELDDRGDNVYTILANGTEIEASNFQNYYSDFVSIQCSNFKIEDTSSNPNAIITFGFSDEKESIVEFYRINDTEYQYSIDGIAMGRIPSSAYNKMIKNLRTIAAGEAVS